jgi:hypothetical protein
MLAVPSLVRAVAGRRDQNLIGHEWQIRRLHHRGFGQLAGEGVMGVAGENQAASLQQQVKVLDLPGKFLGYEVFQLVERIGSVLMGEVGENELVHGNRPSKREVRVDDGIRDPGAPGAR